MIEVKAFEELDVRELYDILKLRSEVFVVEQDCVYQDVDGIDKSAIHMYYVKGEKLVSYIRIYGDKENEKHIGRVVTDPDYRGIGISRTLMLEAINYLTSQGVEAVVLSGQKYLRSFYESLGFVVPTEEYLEDGIPHLGMKKLL